jgi:hypothetical protein
MLGLYEMYGVKYNMLRNNSAALTLLLVRGEDEDH